MTKWGSQIAEQLLIFPSTCPLKVQTCRGLDPIFQSELLNTGRMWYCDAYSMPCTRCSTSSRWTWCPGTCPRRTSQRTARAPPWRASSSAGSHPCSCPRMSESLQIVISLDRPTYLPTYLSLSLSLPGMRNPASDMWLYMRCVKLVLVIAARLVRHVWLVPSAIVRTLLARLVPRAILLISNVIIYCMI